MNTMTDVVKLSHQYHSLKASAQPLVSSTPFVVRQQSGGETRPLVPLFSDRRQVVKFGHQYHYCQTVD